MGDRARVQRSSVAYTQATDTIRRLVTQLAGEVGHWDTTLPLVTCYLGWLPKKIRNKKYPR